MSTAKLWEDNDICLRADIRKDFFSQEFMVHTSKNFKILANNNKVVKLTHTINSEQL